MYKYSPIHYELKALPYFCISPVFTINQFYTKFLFNQYSGYYLYPRNGYDEIKVKFEFDGLELWVDGLELWDCSL